MMKNHQDNLLLANCDSWTSMHCRHPIDPNRKKSLISKMQISRNKQRMRSSSANSARSLRRSSDALHAMTVNSGTRSPFKMVCRNGPGCKNHDWDTMS